jgi:GNAT superfamily N-acetyltransferase
MDITSFGADIIKRIADDLYFFVSIKEHSADNKPKDILGFMMTAITPALAYGDIKLITVAVDPKASNCGLDELLLSSVFKVIPDIQRIFTMIRPTNKHALHTYMSRGFTKDCNPVQDPNHPINTDYLVSLEYKTKQSDRLQKVAETLVD